MDWSKVRTPASRREHPPPRLLEVCWRVRAPSQRGMDCERAGITDLHFHDLRREAGSRWLEGGVPLHTVRDWLGNTNIAQTSTYLASTLQSLQGDAMSLRRTVRPGGRGARRVTHRRPRPRVQTGANLRTNWGILDRI